MKKTVLLLFCLIYSHASDIVVGMDSKSIELKLTETLKNIKQYKRDKSNQIVVLNIELEAIKKEFDRYKRKKENELNTIKKALRHSSKALRLKKSNRSLMLKKVKKKLKNTEKKLFNKTKELKSMEEKLLNQKDELISIDKYQVITNEADLSSAITMAMEKAMTEPLSTEWIEVVIADSTNIHELALRYYADQNEYAKIYAANKNVISNNLELHEGMVLKIPMSNKFREQPILINRD